MITSPVPLTQSASLDAIAHTEKSERGDPARAITPADLLAFGRCPRRWRDTPDDEDPLAALGPSLVEWLSLDPSLAAKYYVRRPESYEAMRLECYHLREGLKWTEIDPDTGSATPTHPYYARPWEWLLPPGRPTSFYVNDLGPDIQQILGHGSPLTFCLNLVAMPVVAWAWISKKRRDWRAGFILVAFLGLLLPWLRISRPTFYFYVLPLTPFVVLAVTSFLREISDLRIVVRDRRTGEVAMNPETGLPAVSTAYVYRPFVWAYLLASALLFVWFWPVLTAGPISDVHWRAIVWFNRWI